MNTYFLCTLIIVRLEKMCHLWARIRHGVRWDRKEQTELALKALIASMKDVKSVEISMDPFHGDTTALRY